MNTLERRIEGGVYSQTNAMQAQFILRALNCDPHLRDPTWAAKAEKVRLEAGDDALSNKIIKCRESLGSVTTLYLHFSSSSAVTKWDAAGKWYVDVVRGLGSKLSASNQASTLR